ncbi:MAG TPA: hypothetical protein VFZ16_01765 [Hyphomicrobiaceae bacterium]|nr:hypothetical protein [Hyphomicrobiaceae bacterium]
MRTTAARWSAAAALCLSIAGTCLAQGPPTQTPPAPGPTVPPKTLPVPKGGENLVINPTRDECKAGWRPGLRWTQAEFDKFCKQMNISK